ncbi:HvfA family oxazolone/thioamide-modified RiPP metallophore [Wenzhouxiangella sp. EGI_FJ10409]|uniref:HvfA family oxazolone/thioamide-modified RiPP metallophore n=1 Tax=Wenzhouxiangella sp. EGI_FJ10409 TaxID=3243767 RepID=UPI0035D6E59F
MSDKKHLLTAISTVAAASFSLSAMASQGAGADPFQAEDLPAGFQVSADDHKEGKCGEGSCGEDKDEEGSCGEGSCGEGSCGEDSDDDKDDKDDKDEEGSCGEGTCGVA